MQVKRGDIYYADLSPVVGSEQGGIRPVLIIQNDVGNRHSPTVICAAITSRMNKAKLPTHVEIDARRYHIVKNSVVLLEQIRTIDKQRLMVIVLDEYGQTSGLVAMEDILEEIVGNILDEYDEEDEMIKKQNDGSMIANGLTELEDLEDLIPVIFDKEDYETLNGFLIDELEHIPGEDEKCVVDYEGYRFTALQVDNNIIQTVKIEKLPEA